MDKSISRVAPRGRVERRARQVIPIKLKKPIKVSMEKVSAQSSFDLWQYIKRLWGRFTKLFTRKAAAAPVLPERRRSSTCRVPKYQKGCFGKPKWMRHR